MNAAFFDDTEVAAAAGVTSKVGDEDPQGKRIGVAEFRSLAVSHRRMVRVDRPEAGLKGLRDMDTGETFYTDALRLLAR
jgi:hypothetical protein